MVDGLLLQEYQELNKNFAEAVEKTNDNITQIIKSDNEIVLMDNQLIMSKNKQVEFIKKLRTRTVKSLEEAEKAMDGSASNSKRGKQLCDDYQNVDKLIESDERDELNRLIVEANSGWNLAIDVNKNSISQLEYAEMVYEYTKELHKDSLIIKDLVHKKQHVFEQNLQVITILTVFLSVKFKQYLDVEKIFKKFEETEINKDHLNDLLVLVDISCKEIKGLLSLNLDMTAASHINNETETKSIQLTDQEISYFEDLKQEVELTTEATQVSIDGSQKNISNCKLLEKKVKELVQQL